MTTDVVEVVVAPTLVVEVVGQGPQGPAGPGAQPARFVFTAPALQWNVPHNLGRRPIVTLETVGGVEMIAEITHLSDNVLVVGFDEPTTGAVKLI